MPFGEYEDFDACVAANGDKADPKAYCAAIKRDTEGKERSPFQITKDAEGNLRWLGIVSNNFRDRDNPPQIIEAKAHQEFEDYLDKGGDYPPLMIWHTAGTEFGTTDCMGEHEGFLVATGTINKGMEPVAEALSKEKVDLGMSHGFEYRHSDQSKEIIGWYRIREVSVLPLEFAANPWTAFRTIDKEKEMKPEKKSFLERVLGKDRVDTLAKSLGEASASLKAQVESKEVKPEVKPAEPAPVVNNNVVTAKAIPEDPEVSEAEGQAMKAIADTVVAVKDIAKALPDMVKRIEALEAGNKALADENAKLKAEIKKSHDDIVAQAFNPRGGFAYVPSQATDNVVKEGDALQKAKPAVDEGFLKSLHLPGVPAT
jgi:hypothetical protein